MKQFPRVRCMLSAVDARWYGIRAEHRWVVKTLPRRDRYWNSNLKAWVTPVAVTATLPARLQAVGYDVVMVDVSRHIEPRDWHEVYRARFGHPCPHAPARLRLNDRADRDAVHIDPHLELATALTVKVFGLEQTADRLGVTTDYLHLSALEAA